MMIRRAALYIVLILMAALGGSCAGTPGAAGDAEKTLMPHRSWTCGMPEGIPQPEKGVPVFEVEMKLDQVYDVGETLYGRRQVLVVGGGAVTGAMIQGTVLPGGLDFQLVLTNGAIEIEQVLVLRTSDGKYIYLHNAGVGVTDSDVRVVLDCEAPNSSAFAWLNTGQYVGRRVVDLKARTLKMTVYNVAEVPAGSDTTGVVWISKPSGVLPQPWDCRKVSPAEKLGEAFVAETVTLGAGLSVGVSKRGPRNIIPITGGTVTGDIRGKVLLAGADYQNLSAPATLDARYLWQTNDGEIIIVRNAGPFGALVPTFETRLDGQYAWLNTGLYLSSNPRIGPGNVTLTMYKSK